MRLGGTRRSRRDLRTIALVAALPLALAACSGGSPAGEPSGDSDQGWTPSRDVEWIVPYSPGGGFDIYSRGVAKVMESEGLLPDGVHIVIRNTTPLPQGLTQLFTADPDGQTIGILPMPAAIAMEIQNPDIARWTTSDYTILGQVDENVYVVYVAADSPFQSIDDLIAAKGMRTLATEEGSSADLATKATIAALGLDATNVYGMEGSAEIVAGALRGDAEFFVTGASDVVGYVESGDIRPLLVLSTEDQRPSDLEWLADVPTAESAGYPELAGAVTELRVIVAPPELPEPVATFWRDALEDTLASDAFADWATTAERPYVPRDAEATTASVQSQIERMQELIPQLAD